MHSIGFLNCPFRHYRHYRLQGHLYDYAPTPEEAQLLSRVRNLARKWGYRAGPQGNHTGFEYKLHTGKTKEIYTLTQLTDPLFRTLQQGTAYSSDLRGKFFFPTWFQDDPLGRGHVALQLLANFLQADKSVAKHLGELANASLTGESTWWFAVLVTSAKILCLLSEGQIPKAKHLTDQFRKCLDHQLRLEEEEEEERSEWINE